MIFGVTKIEIELSFTWHYSTGKLKTETRLVRNGLKKNIERPLIRYNKK